MINRLNQSLKPADELKIRLWYLSGAVLVFLILIVGGITRLTESGLSIVEWNPVLGAIPPLNEAQWQEAFEQYKQFPEYQQRNAGMSLSEFRYIFFWEYLHRMLGRITVLVFIIPFGYFLYKKTFNRQQLKRALFLLGLGFFQGLMGWYMVKSGLADVPYVSHFRLAMHLLLAFIIFGACIYFAADLTPKTSAGETSAREFKHWLTFFFILFTAQVLWGAFVAGLKAGYIYNTFPTMQGEWLPPEAFLMTPFLKNLVENPAAVQLVHRVIGTLLGLYVLVFWIITKVKAQHRITKTWALYLVAAVMIQYAIGILTLIFGVPVWLGTIHQAAALLILGIGVGFYHHLHHRSQLSLTVQPSKA